jgi:hypothetical protein
MTVRVEFTVPDDRLAQIDEARGEVPRAAWIKGRLFEVLDQLWEPQVVVSPPPEVRALVDRRPPLVSVF